MFCMNCGQQLPDGAKFCLNCGTPQGAVSPTGTAQAETINLDGMHTFVPALCPNCSAHMKVDSSAKVAHCDSCGTECLVQDAIKALTVRGNVQVGSATINVSGTNTDSLLQRVEIMLGDCDFREAMSKCDSILDSDPTNGKVYFYMLMASLNCRNRNELANKTVPFDRHKYYINAMRYGDSELKKELLGYANIVNTRYRAAKQEAEAKAKQEAEARAKQEAKQKNPKVGDKIYFGTNDGQCIWWEVLSVNEHKALIIANTNFEIMPYHQPGGFVAWAGCTLRKWLNSDFINTYFTPTEQERIIPCYLKNYKNPQYRIATGGVNTTDKVFLLSIDDAKRFFADNQARIYGNPWWLRSPGRDQDCAAYVDFEGAICYGGTEVSDYFLIRVRPALWLNLDS